MTKKELEHLFWRIQGLFNEHVGCLADGCHCSGDATKFHDDLLKLLHKSIKTEEE